MRKSFNKKEFGLANKNTSQFKGAEGSKKFAAKPYDKKPYGKDEKKPFGDNSFEKKPYEKKPFGDKSFEKKPYEKKAFGEKSFLHKPYEKKVYAKKTDEEKSAERLREEKFGVFAKNPLTKTSKNDNEHDNNNTSVDVRLNRYIANAGVCSRREADMLIEAGRISVNGEILKEMGYKVKASDVVEFDGKKLRREKLVYVLLNKPKNYITTTDDPEERRTVMSLIEKACPQRIYPVGRLDRNTTGLLLFTNDGELADSLAHPSNNIKKVYQALLDKAINEDDLNAIAVGVTLEDGLAPVDKVALLMPDIVGLEIHLGRNRIVRRIFEHLGYEVVKLDRTVYAGLTKKDLPRGEYRFLTEQEIINLKHLGK